MHPWEQPIPPTLYKYLGPQRLDVLTNCRVRFSQRTVFPDDHELQPEYERFGTEDEMCRFVFDKGIGLDPRIPANVLLHMMADDANIQGRLLETTRRYTRSTDEFGVLCLTEHPDSDQMWMEYADDEYGFVIGFDTTHASFDLLKTPGKIGKVTYSDVPYGTLLGTMETEGAATFFRKRMRYAFEQEWRAIRALYRLERHPGDIYLSPFDPQSVREIIIRDPCVLAVQLRQLVAADSRYRHVRIIQQDHR